MKTTDNISTAATRHSDTDQVSFFKDQDDHGFFLDKNNDQQPASFFDTSSPEEPLLNDQDHSDNDVISTPVIQTKCEACEQEEAIQKKSIFGNEEENALVQTKELDGLTVGEPDDQYEEEADAMADEVVQKMDDSASPDEELISTKQEEAPALQEKSENQNSTTESQGDFNTGQSNTTSPGDTFDATHSDHTTQSVLSPVNPLSVQMKCESCEKEEEEENQQQDIQKKPIFDSAADPPEDDHPEIQRRAKELEKTDYPILFKKIPEVQLSGGGGSEDTIRERIVKEAQKMVGKIEARKDDGSGRRVGADHLLEIFHLAAKDAWPDEVIENVRYTQAAKEFPHWCGIFSVYAIKKAGIDLGYWQIGRGVSAFGTLKPTDDPKPGDIGYFTKFQHHCIIKAVNGDTIDSIDGNSGDWSEVKERSRPKTQFHAFFSPFTGSEKMLQAKPEDSHQQTNGSSLKDDLDASAGSGSPIDEQTRDQMEAGFGADFGNVNIHTDSKARQMNESLHAQAFTHGKDIYFNQGKYDPHSTSGKYLLAHELTHTIQQGATDFQSPTVQKQEVTFSDDQGMRIVGDAVVEPGDENYRQRFLGATVMQYVGNNYLFLTENQRYITAQGIGSAYNYGRTFFGAGTFALLYGYTGEGADRHSTYFVVPLKKSIPSSELNPLPPSERSPDERLFNGTVMPVAGRDFAVKGLFFDQGAFVASPNPQVNRIVREQIQTEIQQGLAGMNVGLVQEKVFEEIDVLIEAGDLQEASKRLSLLAEPAFSLLGWEKKQEYIKVLIDAWTYRAQEKAIVEIVKSTKSLSELNAMIEMLKAAGVFLQLLDDLDYEKWSFFGAIGKNFGAIQPMNLTSFLDLLTEFGLGPMVVTSIDELLDEVTVLWDSFLGFIVGIWDAVVMLITEPDKIIQGLGGLIKMVYMLNLATSTSVRVVADFLELEDVQKAQKDAVVYMNNLFQVMSKKIMEILAGVTITDMEAELGRRLRWIIIWEILSMFIGVGEIKAALTAARLTAKSLSMTRILRVLNIVEDGADAARYLQKFEELARSIGRVSELIRAEDEILKLLAYLPDGDIQRLRHAIDNLGDTELTQLSQLGELGVQIQKKVDVLSVLSARAGGMSDDIAEVFAHLSHHFDDTDQLLDLVKLIPEGEGALFTRMVGSAPGRSMDFYKTMTRSKENMEALIDLGANNMDRIFAVARGDADEVTRYLNAIDELRRSFPEGTQAAQFRRFLDNIEPVSLETYDALIKNPALRDALIDNPLAAAVMKRCASPCFPPHATEDQVRRIGALAEGKPIEDLRKLNEYIYLNRDNLEDALRKLEGNFRRTLDDAILRSFDEISAPDAWKKAAMYDSLLTHLDPLGISPTHFQHILDNAMRSESPHFIWRLNNTLASLNTPPPMHNVSELLYGLASKNGDTYQSARFLMERIHNYASKGAGKIQVDSILSRFSLEDIATIRRSFPFDPVTASDEVAGLASALGAIVAKTDLPADELMILINKAGIKATDEVADPDVIRLAAILDGMPMGQKHSREAIEAAILRQNTIADELAGLGEEIVEGIFRDLGDLTTDPGGIKLVMDHFDRSGSRAIGYFTEAQRMKGIVKNILGEGSEINAARWRKIQEAIRKTDMKDSIQNNIIGRYWEEVNEAAHIATGKKLDKDLFPQLDVNIPNSEIGARIDMGIIQSKEVDGDVVKITLKLEEYKTGNAKLSEGQKLVQGEVASAIAENRPVNLQFGWPDELIPSGKRVEVRVPIHMDPVRPE